MKEYKLAFIKNQKEKIQLQTDALVNKVATTFAEYLALCERIQTMKDTLETFEEIYDKYYGTDSDDLDD
jgi:outer membrane protein TolC